MSGSNTTCYTVCGSEITKHLNISVKLPNKHDCGGQSKQRFERLAEEARHNYITKIIENIMKIYPSTIPLVVGGPALLKNKMVERLSDIASAPKVLKVIDIQYDGQAGFYELLNQCTDLVTSLQIDKERKYIATFMNSIAISDGLAIYGEVNINYCLTNGLIKVLIVHEDMLTDEITQICEKFSTDLQIITKFLPESDQIKMGFGGKVGLLRYVVDLPEDDDDEQLQQELQYEY
jgi:peptide subunit release factor 1 (eRF1)